MDAPGEVKTLKKQTKLVDDFLVHCDPLPAWGVNGLSCCYGGGTNDGDICVDSATCGGGQCAAGACIAEVSEQGVNDLTHDLYGPAVDVGPEKLVRKCQHAVSKADFSKPYDAAGSERPLGEAPLLLARIQTGHDRNGQPVVALHPAQGQGITLTFDSVLLHSVCRLLQAAVKKSDWDMELKLPGTEPEANVERAVRTLN